MSSQFHNPTFIRHVHRRAVLRHLQQMLKENHIELDSGPREPIVCEDAMYADRIVSQEALLDVLDGLEQLEAMELLGMSKFELKERGIVPLRLPPPPKETDSNDSVEQQKEQEGSGQEPQQGSGPSNQQQRSAPDVPGNPGGTRGGPGAKTPGTG